jgi:hypothetical protein
LETIAACLVFWVPFISLSLWMGMFSGEIWGILRGEAYWRAPVPFWAGIACWIAFICFDGTAARGRLMCSVG